MLAASLLLAKGQSNGALSANEICRKIKAILPLHSSLSIGQLHDPRVEVRQCSVERGLPFLQLVAYGGDSEQPTFVIETDQINLVQSVAMQGVAALEFGGGSSNRAFVVEFHDGSPRLALMRFTREPVLISADGRQVVLEIRVGTRGKEAYRFPSGPRKR